MNPAENKEFILRFTDRVWNNAEVDAANDFIASDLINHPTGVNGIDDYKRIAKLSADWVNFEVTHVFAEDDLVMLFAEV